MKELDYFKSQLEHVSRLVKSTNKKSVLIIQQYPKADRSTPLQIPPIRESLSNIICFVSVTDETIIEKIISLSKETIDLIVLDTDNKRDNSIQIISAANDAAQKYQIPIVPYSDFETWSIAAVNFILQVEGKMPSDILVIGTSQLTSHIIQDLLSRNARICLLKEEYPDGVKLDFDNETHLSFVSDRIKFVDSKVSSRFDILLSCSILENSSHLADLSKMRFNHIYDIGLNNFTKQFICEQKEKGALFFRSDDHAGIASMIVNLMESEYLVKRNLAKAYLADITVVSGGLIGDEGDIVVDNADNPTTVFGVANGLGLFKTELSDKDKKNLEKIQSLLK